MDYLLADVNLFFAFILMAANVNAIAFISILLLTLLVITFIISGAEVALFSLTGSDINMLKTKDHPAARRIINLLKEPKQLYASLLLSSTFINICIIVLANALIYRSGNFKNIFSFLDSWGYAAELLIKVAIIAVVLIFFGKILPKVTAAQNNIRFAYGSAYVIDVIHAFLYRISSSVVKFADSFGKNLGSASTPAKSAMELDRAIDIASKDNTSLEEKNILKGIIKFGKINVKNIMRARLDISGINHTSSFSELLKKISELNYSRLPVYRESMDNVAGVINTKDILSHIDDGDHFEWQALIRPPYFVPETKLIEDLLKEFQEKRVHFAVVVDEFGGTSGIVTLEDILEEIIGDIRDEFDEEEGPYIKIDETTYIFEGKTSITDICRTMALPHDTFEKIKGESESIAGLVMELAGEIPEINGVVSNDNFAFTVLEIVANRITKIKVTINTDEEKKD